MYVSCGMLVKSNKFATNSEFFLMYVSYGMLVKFNRFATNSEFFQVYVSYGMLLQNVSFPSVCSLWYVGVWQKLKTQYVGRDFVPSNILGK